MKPRTNDCSEASPVAKAFICCPTSKFQRRQPTRNEDFGSVSSEDIQQTAGTKYPAQIAGHFWSMFNHPSLLHHSPRDIQRIRVGQNQSTCERDRSAIQNLRDKAFSFPKRSRQARDSARRSANPGCPCSNASSCDTCSVVTSPKTPVINIGRSFLTGSSLPLRAVRQFSRKVSGATFAGFCLVPGFVSYRRRCIGCWFILLVSHVCTLLPHCQTKDDNGGVRTRDSFHHLATPPMRASFNSASLSSLFCLSQADEMKAPPSPASNADLSSP